MIIICDSYIWSADPCRERGGGRQRRDYKQKKKKKKKKFQAGRPSILEEGC